MKFELARRKGREEIGQILKICQSFSPEWQLWQNWQLWQRWQSGRQALELQKLQKHPFFSASAFPQSLRERRTIGDRKFKNKNFI